MSTQTFTRLATAQPAEAKAEDMSIPFVFATCGKVRGDNHELKPGCWVANWGKGPKNGLTNYNRSPIVIEGHNPASRGVAKVTAIQEQRDGRLVGVVRFADTDDGRELYELYRSGVMSACSIGWATVEATKSTDPARGYGALDITRAELLEVSLVSVGADENALVLGRSAKRDNDRSRIYAQAREAMTFRSFGEQLRAVWTYRANGVEDHRLQRAPLGAGEIDPAGGGFLVADTFLPTLVESLYRESVLLPLCDVRETASPLGAVKIPAISEVSRADGSRAGGSLSYWLSEGSQVNSSYPRFTELTFSGKKLAALCYVSNELADDAPMLESALRSAFASESGYQTDRAILQGTGAGQPLGIVNAPCKVTIAKENGQAAATITATNLRKMWSALPGPCRERAIWIASENVEEQLDQTAGGLSELYLPRGANGNERPLLKGRPIYFVESASALGTEGDIVLADMASYIVVHGGLKLSLSADVQFISDQSVFRFVYRIDGQPAYASSLTAANGSGQKSPFVTLATRA